jgi:citrate synthase
MPSPYLTAAQAADALNISLPSLYAYVSRGLIRSEAAGGAKRQRRYRAEDVRVLKQRKELRRNPTKVVERALHWGEPVMESAITMIADGRFFYRGHDAVALAESRSIEEVAALLWRGDPAQADALFATKLQLTPRCLAVRKHLSDIATIEALQILISLAAVDDVAGFDLRPAAVAQTGARILSLMSEFVAGGIGQGKSIAQGLQSAWAPRKPKAADLINTALILCADHELNVSSFTARCIASAGSTPYAVIVGGLTALQGVKHGRATERVEALLREARTPHGVAKVIAAHLKRGGRIPGFGHPLYPDGDPRGRTLLEAVETNFPKSAALAFAEAASDAAMRLIGDRPSIDFALVIAARALSLPADGAVSLFAIGRTVGWIGHAIEQYQRDRIIRPRARYVGELPR